MTGKMFQRRCDYSAMKPTGNCQPCSGKLVSCSMAKKARRRAREVEIVETFKRASYCKILPTFETLKITIYFNEK